MTLTARILIGMGLGILLGVICNLLLSASWLPNSIATLINTGLVDGLFDIVGSIFIASLKLLVVPLVLVSLVCGVTSLSDNSRMGRMAIKTLGLYLLTTAIAVALALSLANLIDPGKGFNMGEAMTFEAKKPPSLKETLINIFPSNPIQSMAEGNMLQIIVFAILVGIAINKSGSAGQSIRSFFTDFNEVIMKMVTILMHFAPYGVFAMLARLFAELGIGVFEQLIWYFLAVTLALLAHASLTYPLLLRLLSGLRPLTLFRNIRPAMLFAFSTSSSSATLPVTINVAEKRAGIDNSVASFTLPLGATINMDGTAIMQGVATVFIAQAFNVDIGLMGYLTVILTATLASVGAAGVPGVGLITLALVLQQVNLPVEGIALIIGVDRLLDMMRTAVNISGDCMVSTVVAKSEGKLDEDLFNTVDDSDEYEQDEPKETNLSA